MLCLDAAGVGAFAGVSARAAPRPFPRAADCTTHKTGTPRVRSGPRPRLFAAPAVPVCGLA